MFSVLSNFNESKYGYNIINQISVKTMGDCNSFVPFAMLLQNFNELNNTSDKLSIFLTSSSTIKKWAKHIKIQVRQGLKCH